MEARVCDRSSVPYRCFTNLGSSDERLGIRIFPATLETMRGVGHSWEADNCLTLGASVRGSKAYSESVGTSCGRSTSTNSPGQMLCL